MWTPSGCVRVNRGKFDICSKQQGFVPFIERPIDHRPWLITDPQIFYSFQSDPSKPMCSFPSIDWSSSDGWEMMNNFSFSLKFIRREKRRWTMWSSFLFRKENFVRILSHFSSNIPVSDGIFPQIKWQMFLDWKKNQRTVSFVLKREKRKDFSFSRFSHWSRRNWVRSFCLLITNH